MVDLEVAWVHSILKVGSVLLVPPEEVLEEDHLALMADQCGNQKGLEQATCNLIYQMISILSTILSRNHLARVVQVAETIRLDQVVACSCDL